MEFVFYNEITGEQKEILADDGESAVQQLHECVDNPFIWRLMTPIDSLPTGFFESFE